MLYFCVPDARQYSLPCPGRWLPLTALSFLKVDFLFVVEILLFMLIIVIIGTKYKGLCLEMWLPMFFYACLWSFHTKTAGFVLCLKDISWITLRFEQKVKLCHLCCSFVLALSFGYASILPITLKMHLYPPVFLYSLIICTQGYITVYLLCICRLFGAQYN